MKKIAIILLILFTWSSADFMSGVESVIKHTLSSKKKKHKFPKLETVGTVTGGGNISSVSLVDSVVSKVRKTIGVEETTVLQDSSLFKDIVTKVEDTMGLGKKNSSIFSDVLTTVGVVEEPKKEKSMIDNMFSKVKNTIGINKKKHSSNLSLTSMMGSVTNTMGITQANDASLFGDLKSSSSNVFSGFKNSGKSAELMSGIMYKSTKMYNKMFGVFSDSPLNMFEKKKEKSILDIFDTGNDLLDLWD